MRLVDPVDKACSCTARIYENSSIYNSNGPVDLNSLMTTEDIEG